MGGVRPSQARTSNTYTYCAVPHHVPKTIKTLKYMYLVGQNRDGTGSSEARRILYCFRWDMSDNNKYLPWICQANPTYQLVEKSISINSMRPAVRRWTVEHLPGGLRLRSNISDRLRIYGGEIQSVHHGKRWIDGCYEADQRRIRRRQRCRAGLEAPSKRRPGPQDTASTGHEQLQ